MKDESKKVITDYIFGVVHAYCPTCGTDITSYHSYECVYCGQKLAGQDTSRCGQVVGYLWSEQEDESDVKRI